MNESLTGAGGLCVDEIAFHNGVVPNPPVIAIFGPTAVGKTDVAIELGHLLATGAKKPFAVSADAFALYKEMPIISGAPTSGDLSQLEHGLVGEVSVCEEFSVGQFAPRAHWLVDSAREEGRPVIVVGGTGLYMQAATRRMELSPKVDPQIRDRLARRMEREGPAAMHESLSELNQEAALRIDPNDSRRVTRALELIEAGLDPVGESDGIWAAAQRHPTLFIGLTRDREDLRGRISRRIESMVRQGAREEALAIEAMGPSKTAAAAIGYREMLDGARDRMETRTWQLAKRQLTWMRKASTDHTFNLTEVDAQAVAVEIKELAEACGNPAQDID